MWQSAEPNSAGQSGSVGAVFCDVVEALIAALGLDFAERAPLATLAVGPVEISATRIERVADAAPLVGDADYVEIGFQLLGPDAFAALMVPAAIVTSARLDVLNGLGRIGKRDALPSVFALPIDIEVRILGFPASGLRGFITSRKECELRFFRVLKIATTRVW